MLVVTVEVWPGGNIRRRRVISSAQMINISNLNEISDYEVYIDGVQMPDVEGHKRSDGAWKLIQLALNERCPRPDDEATVVYGS